MDKVAILTVFYDEGYDGCRGIELVQCFSIDENLKNKVSDFIADWADKRYIQYQKKNKHFMLEKEIKSEDEVNGMVRRCVVGLFDEDSSYGYIGDYDFELEFNAII